MRLSAGLLNLGTLRLIAPHLTPENQEELFELAKAKTKRAVEEALAAKFPRPDVASSVRKLPAATIKALESARAAAPGVHVELEARDQTGGHTTGSEATSGATRALSAAAGGMDAPGEAEHLVVGAGTPCPPRSALLVPLSPDRYQFRFTASGATLSKFEQARDRLRHAVPTGDAAEIFDRALTALLKELDRTQFAATDRPHGGRGASARAGEAGARTITAAIKRAVWARDGGRCAFIAGNGRRCGAAAFLEFHHVVPYARGGPATERNIQLRCRAHNGYEAELDFGLRQLVPGQVGVGPDTEDASIAVGGNRGPVPT